MTENDEGMFSPADYAQAHFELNGAEMDESTKSLFKEYQWSHGDFHVTSEYAPENEETRIYYIVTLNGNEFMRCRHESAITSIFDIIDQNKLLSERCAELEAKLGKNKKGLLSKLFS
ncbi:hypothetical protein [Saccharophagus degradans]|uniref:Uncharacterized protein n=1 Tax=Saccharophagus degradans (strain 2-40 / ATCC 43961 / DSM 17024) TaxID=203122 RepID=Q21I91_SACD2|nr:hypothetical protein [Saccharophagus degradans]ABD81588.1 hypothetical protein Sde_2328 [Saccharophagus degradans 2-40]